MNRPLRLLRLCADPEHKHILGSEPGISSIEGPACGLGRGGLALEVY